MKKKTMNVFDALTALSADLAKIIDLTGAQLIFSTSNKKNDYSLTVFYKIGENDKNFTIYDFRGGDVDLDYIKTQAVAEAINRTGKNKTIITI